MFMLGLPATRAVTLGLYAAILFSHAVLNHVGVRVVSLLNWFSAWYHVAGVALVVAVLSVLAPKQPLGFFFQGFTAEHVRPSLHGPWPAAYGFLVGLLQATWTFTGYDASAHVTEETRDPSRNAPWGIFLSVAVSGVAGYAMLFAVTLAIPDLATTAAAEKPFIHVLQRGLGTGIGNALIWVVLGAMWFCGLASITSNSRMLFAFARDGGLPFSGAIARVSPTFKSPHVAVWVSAGAAFIVALWAAAYTAMTALSTIALYASYGVPVALGLMARRAGRWTRRGPWNLGGWSTLINGVALAWIAVLMVLFVIPPNTLAGYTFAGLLALLAVYWFAYMGSRFKGPPVAPLTEAERPRS